MMAERARTLLLALVPSITMLVFLVGSATSPHFLNVVLRGAVDRVAVGTFLCVVAAYEFYSLVSIERLMRNGQKPSTSRRYFDAFVETSIPTCVTLYYASIVDPVRALLMPTSYVYFVFILLSTLRLNFSLSSFTGAVAAAQYGSIAYFVLPTDPTPFGSLASFPHYAAKAAILLMSGFAAGFVGLRLRRSFAAALSAHDEQNRIVAVFGQHVSPAVALRLLEQGAEPKSELRRVWVMFLDIRNFTSFAEKRTPDDVVSFLNTVFDATNECVNAHGGIVNKFLGDGFMAIFGAPIADENPCADAIDTSIAILASIERLTSQGTLPPTRVGIGLHAGLAVVGNVGSASRKEYTVIGDVVNVASRLEALNKELGSQLLLTEEVWDASGRREPYATPCEALSVRGREQPIKVWRLS